MILSLTYKLLLSNTGVLAHNTGSDPGWNKHRFQWNKQFIKFRGFLWQSAVSFVYARLQLDLQKLMVYFPSEKLPDFFKRCCMSLLPGYCYRGQNFVCICALVRILNLQKAFLEHQEKCH